MRWAVSVSSCINRSLTEAGRQITNTMGEQEEMHGCTPESDTMLYGLLVS